MELKPGYKRTDAGIIPSDWDAVPLGKIGDALIGLTYRPEDVRPHGTLVLRASNIQNDKLAFDDNVYVGVEVSEQIMVRPGDVLVCVRNGSRNLIGKAAFLDERCVGMTFGAFMAVHRGLDGRLVNYLFQSDILKRQINEHLGATINQITNRSLNAFRIPFPPTEAERESIGTTLSDVDALLDELDRLIAKKRDLKQAAMQELLTGRTRLPGFTDEWEARQLSGVGEIRSGGTPSTAQSQYWDGGVPWCTPTDITGLKGQKYLTETSRTISQAGLKASSAEVVPPRSLIMTSRATIGECAINLVAMTTNQGFKNIVPFSGVDVEFLYYMMTTQKAGLVQLCGGSTFLEIGKRQLAAYQIKMPKTEAEQSAIATVLSEIDAELSALEARRDKTRLLKQAMMQELLTGRTRLVDAKGATA